MNALFISRNSPFESIGGIERYITNLIAYYKKLDSQAFIMLPTKSGNPEEKITKESFILFSSSNKLSYTSMHLFFQ